MLILHEQKGYKGEQHLSRQERDLGRGAEGAAAALRAYLHHVFSGEGVERASPGVGFATFYMHHDRYMHTQIIQYVYARSSLAVFLALASMRTGMGSCRTEAPRGLVSFVHYIFCLGPCTGGACGAGRRSTRRSPPRSPAVCVRSAPSTTSGPRLQQRLCLGRSTSWQVSEILKRHIYSDLIQ